VTDYFDSKAHIVVEELTMAYGDFVLQRDLTFTIRRGEIFIIMGGSGFGKSTLLKHLIGLKKPARGGIYFHGRNYWQMEENDREKVTRTFGVLYQGGALWSSLTLA